MRCPSEPQRFGAALTKPRMTGTYRLQPKWRGHVITWEPVSRGLCSLCLKPRFTRGYLFPTGLYNKVLFFPLRNFKNRKRSIL